MRVKRKISLLLIVSMLGTLILGSNMVFAQGDGVKINAENFPDGIFREYVKGFDTNDDGSLSQEEISHVTEISVPNRDIVNLKGIEFFTALITLDCSNNNLVGFDLSKNVNLNFDFFNASGNEYQMTSSMLDMTTFPGFDMGEVVDWMNVMVKGTEIAPLDSNNPITYKYQVTATRQVEFSIIPDPNAKPLEAPSFTSTNSVSLQTGTKSDFSVTVTGNPTPALSLESEAPAWVSLDDNSGLMTIDATNVPAKEYSFAIKASNFANSATQLFTIIVTPEDTPVIADSQDNLVNFGSMFTGKGTKEDPYLIKTNKEFTITVQGARNSADGATIGDTRYVPYSWKVNPEGTFPVGGPYEIKTKLEKEGTYTLEVVYNEESFDGDKWIATGKKDIKTSTIKVVSDSKVDDNTENKDSTSVKSPPSSAKTAAVSVKTGDSARILLYLAVLILAALVGVFGYQIKKRRK